MDTKSSHKIYVLRYDSNLEAECFLLVTIYEEIPNEDHSYKSRDFDYEFISGDRHMYERCVNSIQNTVWNGLCVGMREFFFENYYEIIQSEPAFFYREKEIWEKSKRMKPVFEVKCRDIYFEEGATRDQMYEIMKKMLEQKVAADRLREEVLKPI